MILRRPAPAIVLPLIPVVAITVLGLFGVFPLWVALVFLVVLPCSVITSMRQNLVLDVEGVSVTVFRTRQIPWNDVVGFNRSGGVFAAARVETQNGPVRSAVPCSIWGGPPSEEQLALLDQYGRQQKARMSPPPAPGTPSS